MEFGGNDTFIRVPEHIISGKWAYIDLGNRPWCARKIVFTVCTYCEKGPVRLPVFRIDFEKTDNPGIEYAFTVTKLKPCLRADKKCTGNGFIIHASERVARSFRAGRQTFMPTQHKLGFRINCTTHVTKGHFQADGMQIFIGNIPISNRFRVWGRPGGTNKKYIRKLHLSLEDNGDYDEDGADNLSTHATNSNVHKTNAGTENSRISPILGINSPQLFSQNGSSNQKNYGNRLDMEKVLTKFSQAFVTPSSDQLHEPQQGNIWSFPKGGIGDPTSGLWQTSLNPQGPPQLCKFKPKIQLQTYTLADSYFPQSNHSNNINQSVRNSFAVEVTPYHFDKDLWGNTAAILTPYDYEKSKYNNEGLTINNLTTTQDKFQGWAHDQEQIGWNPNFDHSLHLGQDPARVTLLKHSINSNSEIVYPGGHRI